MTEISKSLKNLFWSRAALLFVIGVILYVAGEQRLAGYWNVGFTQFLDESKILTHISLAFFIAILLEFLNEKAIRDKISNGARTSMGEVITQVVKVLTRSEEVGKSLDKLIAACSSFYRDEYESRIVISNKGKSRYLIETQVKCKIKNQLNEERKYEFNCGGDDENFTLHKLFVDTVETKFQINKDGDLSGVRGTSFVTKINFQPLATKDVRFNVSYEVKVEDRDLYEMNFCTPTNVKSLIIEIGESCDLKKEQIDVLTTGMPKPKKDYDLEYSFDSCFLPNESLSVLRK